MAKMKILTAKPSQTRESKQQSCGCEEPELHDDLCSLSCVERPQFFYGQVLNDQDLTAIVNYTRQRLALRRFYEGWGVVSGLRTYIDPEKLLSVVVQPGMAIDCCGEDIVLCAPLPVDLSCLVTEGGDCLTPDEEKLVTATPQFAVDLYVHHTEKLTDLRTSLTRRSSSDLVCEYSRAVEGTCVKLKPVVELAPINEAEIWYDRLLVELERTYLWRRQVEPILRTQDQEEQARKATTWLLENPAQQFDALSLYKTQSLNLPQILGLMLIERVNEMLYTCCEQIPACDGVRIARVYLNWDDQTRTYNVQYIHNQPPFRQLLRRTCVPTPLGIINIAPVVGYPVKEARRWLAERGVQINELKKRLPENIEELMSALLAWRADPNSANANDHRKSKIEELGKRLFAVPTVGNERFAVRAVYGIPGTAYEPVILFDFPEVRSKGDPFDRGTRSPVNPPRPLKGSKKGQQGDQDADKTASE